jgi:hypothetical protein
MVESSSAKEEDGEVWVQESRMRERDSLPFTRPRDAWKSVVHSAW